VDVKKASWEKGGAERAEDYTFFCAKGNEDRRLGTGFFVHKRIVSAVRRVEFISDRGGWCSIIVLNVRAPCEDRSDNVKDRFHEELGCVLISFHGTI
jgi:hypothetical protein